MKKNAFASLFLLLALCLSLARAGGVWALAAPEVSAPNVVLAELGSGDVYYAHNETARVYPASLTKLMTVLLAAEAIERGDTAQDTPVMASSNLSFDLEADGSSAGITAGDVHSLDTLLQCALVASANEACNVIAEHIDGSVGAFVERMNRRAAELGCTDTHFANTHGLPNENHYTTAWDMYLIAREAVSHDIVRRICAMEEIVVPATEASAERRFKNTNALLGDNDYYKGYSYEGACGVKTGHTRAAGYCLIGLAERGEYTLLSVVMGAQANTREDGSLDVGSFTDTRTLMDWGFDNFSYQTVLRSTEIVDTLPVSMGSDQQVGVRPQGSLQALLPNDTDLSSFRREIVYNHETHGEELCAPLESGDVLGELTLSKDGRVYGRCALVAASSVSLSRIEFIKSEIAAFFRHKLVRTVIVVLVVLALLYIFLVVRYRILRRRHKRSVKAARMERDRRAAGARVQTPEPSRSVPPPSAPSFLPEDPVWPEESPTQTEMPPERDYFEELFNNKDV